MCREWIARESVSNEVSVQKRRAISAVRIWQPDFWLEAQGKTSFHRRIACEHCDITNTPKMPPVNPFSALRALPVRQKPAAALRASFQRPAAYRAFADNASNNPNKLPTSDDKQQVGPNMQQQEHVSEEAAKMAKITGSEGPDIEGQGTPVQEVGYGD